MKTATSIEEQIQLLEERGMIFNDKEKKAKEILLDIDIIDWDFIGSLYEQSYPSKNNRTHQFKENTLFDDVVTLYYFDHDLRCIITPYLYRIEVSFRTFLTYTVFQSL